MNENTNKNCLQRAVAALAKEGFKITEVKVNTCLDFGEKDIGACADAGFITLTIISKDTDRAIRRGDAESL
jgi:hypothetical protein